MLLEALIIGAVIAVPVIFVEHFLVFPVSFMRPLTATLWMAFVVAGLTEEGFKFLAFFLIIWKNTHFNEKFDGILYTVFIDMGLAGVENIMYVTQRGAEVGLTRAFTAVPAHALFGVIMGYHLGLAKFYPKQRTSQILQAILYPIL